MLQWDAVRIPLRMPIVLPRVRPVWLVWEAYKKFLADGAPDLAAAVAYSALFSIFPLLIGVVAAVGLFIDQTLVRGAIMETLSRYVPEVTARFLDRQITQAIRMRGTFGILAIVGLFWSATAVAATIRNALNRVWPPPSPLPFLRRKVVNKLIELTLVATAGVFMILSLITSGAVFPTLALLIFSVEASPIGLILSTLAPALFSILTFLVIYRKLSNVRVPWFNALVGAVTAGMLFEGIKEAFFWYLRTYARYQLVYGSLTGIIVFMIWMYLAAAILLYGAELASQVGRPYPREVGQG